MVNDKIVEPRYIIIFSLARTNGKASYKELQERTKLNTSTLYMNIKQLQAEGLVTKKDREYVLTEQGWEVARRAVRRLAEIVNAVG